MIQMERELPTGSSLFNAVRKNCCFKKISIDKRGI